MYKSKFLLYPLILGTLLFCLSTCSSSGEGQGNSSIDDGSLSVVPTSQNPCNFNILQSECLASLPPGYIHLKTYKVSGNQQKERHAYIFSKNTEYMIIIVNQGEEGKHVNLTISNSDKKEIVSSNQLGKKYNTISYKCNATGVHYLNFIFEDKTRHCATSILAFKR